jgi:hypothetical protein
MTSGSGIGVPQLQLVMRRSFEQPLDGRSQDAAGREEATGPA